MTCKAKLYIADDHGDNHATMTCQLEEGHAGAHREQFRIGLDTPDAHDCAVEWFGSDRDEAP